MGMEAIVNGRLDDAVHSFEDAIDAFAQCGLVYEESNTRLRLSEALGKAGRGERAALELERASSGLEQFARGGNNNDSASPRRLRASKSPLSKLTRREREVLAELCGGHSNRVIASNLGISEHTVHRHITNLLRKLELSSRSAAVALALSEEQRDERQG